MGVLTRVARKGNALAYCESEARDDVLGGIPMTVIAGPFPLLAFEIKAIIPNQGSSVQH
jgi:hypothetical protein